MDDVPMGRRILGGPKDVGTPSLARPGLPSEQLGTQSVSACHNLL